MISTLYLFATVSLLFGAAVLYETHRSMSREFVFLYLFILVGVVIFFAAMGTILDRLNKIAGAKKEPEDVLPPAP